MHAYTHAHPQTLGELYLEPGKLKLQEFAGLETQMHAKQS